MIPRPLAPILLSLCALLFSPLSVAQPASVLQQSPLFEEPFSDARQLATLPADSAVTVLQRSGGWYQVRDPQQRQGWLHMSRLRLGDGDSTAKVDGAGLSQAYRLLQSGRGASSGTTVATGIRGLDSEELGMASPNPQALQVLARHRASAGEARQFAAAAPLQAQQVSYPPEAR